MSRLSPVIKTLSAAVGALAVTLMFATAVSAATTGTVSSTPAGFTPWLLKGTPNQNVQQLVQCGSTMYAVGTISAIGQGSLTYSRGNAFSFSATTGALTGWDPKANGMVHSIALSPDCSTAYLGGTFTSIHGAGANRIAAVDTNTGTPRPNFLTNANSEVDTLQYSNGHLLVGGYFTAINGASRTRLASLDPSSGSPTPYANLAISGSYPNTGATRIYNSQLNHSGTKMLVEGVFTAIGGQGRRQIAMLDLGASSVTVDSWYSTEFDQACASVESFYVRAANWSPDDAKVYIATTGYKPASGPGSTTSGPRAGLCDSAAAFPSISSIVTHNWINYTGCDSFYAVAADAKNVYVGGHERWANNPLGCDFAGPGSVSRPGIASLSPTNGQATSWNPTRARGRGADDMLVTSAGLWVASDNFSNGASQQCGGQTNHGGICFFPY
jgi:hypothetical protein